jgi:hypothetical protein
MRVNSPIGLEIGEQAHPWAYCQGARRPDLSHALRDHDAPLRATDAFS